MKFNKYQYVNEKSWALAAPYEAIISVLGNKDWLSPEERRRASAFLKEEDQMRFTAARLLLRAMLSSQLNTTPDSLSFELTENGRPFLHNASELDFNLSHGGDWVVIGLSEKSPIGVDVERNRPLAFWEEISPTITAEDDFVVGLKMDCESYLRHWTAKEAALKCLGMGFSIPPETLSIHGSYGQFHCNYSGTELYGHWQELDEEHCLAVAQSSQEPIQLEILASDAQLQARLERLPNTPIC